MRAHGAPNVVDHPALPQHVFHAGPELAHPAKGAAATRSRRHEIAVESKLPSSGALLLRCTPLTRNAKTANWQKVPARAFSVIKLTGLPGSPFSSPNITGYAERYSAVAHAKPAALSRVASLKWAVTVPIGLAWQRAMRRPTTARCLAVLASAAHSRPPRETTGHHHDHGPGPLEYGGENARFTELIYPGGVSDVYCA